MELGPRDIVARAIQTEIDEGRAFEGEYVHLDLRHLGKRQDHGSSPGNSPDRPGLCGSRPCHSAYPHSAGSTLFHGRDSTDLDGETSLPGLFAAGECACVSVHGANRLGGNSLLDTLVFGTRAGKKAALSMDSSKNLPRILLRTKNI